MSARTGFRVSRLLAAATLACLTAIGCSAPGDSHAATAELLAGDPERGRLLMRQAGCGACHRIPGVAGANGLVGPSLDGIASRAYIAGVLPNAPDNMLRWISDPKSVDSLTAMPNVGLTRSEARNVAAYLYTLR